MADKEVKVADKLLNSADKTPKWQINSALHQKGNLKRPTKPKNRTNSHHHLQKKGKQLPEPGCRLAFRVSCQSGR
ncbi:MAG: hypothetical protein K6T88_19640 [Bacillus sp. (in: Bacteria)]|nr:hypothetical protein [Bacillus sp. (in: firmicutes)]